MLLQSHRSFDTLGDYDPAAGTLATFSRKAEPERSSREISGSFDDLGSKRALLYRLSGVLYLQIDGSRMPLEALLIEVRSVNGRHALRVIADGKAVLELEYDPPALDPLLRDDPTPFVEEEDFDFGLFLSNVSRNRSRQARLYIDQQGRQEGEPMLKAAIQKALGSLLKEAAVAVPESGPFQTVSRSFKNPDPNLRQAGLITLSIGRCNAPQQEKLYFEVMVQTPSGLSDSRKWLYSGSKQDIFQSLKTEDEAGASILNSIIEGARSFQRGDLK